MAREPNLKNQTSVTFFVTGGSLLTMCEVLSIFLTISAILCLRFQEHHNNSMIKQIFKHDKMSETSDYLSMDGTAVNKWGC